MNYKISYIKKAVIFLTIFILLFSVFEITARTMYNSSTDFSFQFKCFKETMDVVEVLFWGSSHMDKAINPQFITRKSFNMAFSAQDIYYDYMVIKKYIDKMPRLKAIVLGISISSFGFENGNGYLLKEYFWDAGILPKIRLFHKVISNTSVYLTHQHTFIGDFIKGKKPNIFPIIDKDSVPEPLPQGTYLLRNGYRYTSGLLPRKKLIEDGKTAAKRHSARLNMEMVTRENKDYLRKIIDIANSRNLELIIVTTPTTSYYQKAFTSEFITSFQNNIKEILNDYPSVIHYDFSNMKSLNEWDFSNSDHLNYQGAKKFSMEMNSLLNKEFPG